MRRKFLTVLLATAAAALAGGSDEYDSHVVSTVMVPMRDGVKLATDIYLPAHRRRPAAGQFPVLLTRSAYDKSGERRRGIFFAHRGYVFIAQDCRGTYASEGELYPFINEGRDGYDTIEWAAAQPWSNGRVGTLGASYLGMDQYAAALYRPPHLVAMYTAVAGGNFYKDSAWRGGVPNLTWPLWILNSAYRSPQCARDPKLRDQLFELLSRPENWLNRHPQKRAEDLREFPSRKKAYLDFYAHPGFDSYWKQKGFDLVDYYRELKDVPIFFVSGWYDSFADATLANFTALSQLQKAPKKLLMGPWPHGYGKSECGEATFGQEAVLDERPLQLDWFDHWMRGRPFEVVFSEPVRYFRMGGEGRRTESGKVDPGGEWYTAPAWPPPGGRIVKYFARADGSLSPDAPESGPPSSFVFDPDNPVPTLGGRYRGSCIENQTLRRGDILTYTSAPLRTPLDVTGPVAARLWVGSDAPSTDFTAKLIDVYPDGYAMNVLDGQIRVPGIKSHHAPREVLIELGSSSNLFATGHRIRLDISSSNYPKLEPNPNTGEPAGRWTHRVKARNAVYHDARHPTRVELTALPR